MSLVESPVAVRLRSRSVPRMLLLCAATCGSLSCSDKADSNADGGPNSNSLTCPPSTEPLDPAVVLDDFEDGNSAISPAGRRKGDWYSYGDGTVDGHIEPLGLSPPEAISGGRCGSRMALHLTSAGFLDWGSGVTAAMNWGTNDQGIAGELPYDVSEFKGVTFFARIGDTSSPIVRIQFEDNTSRPEAGICVVGGGPQKECYDGFGVDLPQLSTSWQAYRIPFSGLAQRYFGVPSPALATSQLYDIQFLFPGSAITDFWVDDITFYR